MPNYDVLLYAGPDDHSLTNGSIVYIKPENSFWSNEEMALGTVVTKKNVSLAGFDTVSQNPGIYRIGDLK
jgi:hypothetical protein